MSVRNTNKFLYNPSRLSEQDLLARFIVRQREFGLIWEDVSRTRRDGIDQHFLIIGQRGMGKTTLMLKIAYEIKRDPKLQEWLVPVNFPEELFGVPDLLGLWEVLAKHLEEQFPGLEKQIEPGKKAVNERGVLEAIRRRLKQEGKKLILFIDNFGDLLERLTDIEVHRLREILMSAGDIRLIAASTRLMEHTYQYDKPFFDFFNTVFLDGLGQLDSLQLMQGLAQGIGRLSLFAQIVTENPARIEGIRRLTGGVPRLLLLLFWAMLRDPEAQMIDDLEEILDQVSPYYKHRVEELPDQQRSIFHHVAMAWDAIGAGEIAELQKADSRKISAQLQTMVENDLLEKVETGTRSYLYRVKERFFNIWYLMRTQGSSNSQKLRWLVEFLEGSIQIISTQTGNIELSNIAIQDQEQEYLDQTNSGGTIRTLRDSGQTHYPATIEEIIRMESHGDQQMSQEQWINLQVEKFQNGSIQPNTSFYNSLLRNSSKEEWRTLVLKKMQTMGQAPDRETYFILWHGLRNMESFCGYLSQLGTTWRTDEPTYYEKIDERVIQIIIELWNAKFQPAFSAIDEYFQSQSRQKFSRHTEFILLCIIVRHQQVYLQRLFENSAYHLKDIYKPIWYALQKLMGEPGRRELLRMGPELEETVEEIVDWVQRMRRMYPA